jgi:hypothetical protein
MNKGQHNIKKGSTSAQAKVTRVKRSTLPDNVDKGSSPAQSEEELNTCRACKQKVNKCEKRKRGSK